VFKGSKQVGPDFLEAGDLVLDGLELGSRFTWNLTHLDVLCEKPMYTKDNDSPWVFAFCGTEAYSGLRRFINEPGTDGTVRWAGCALNTVKFSIDLSREAEKHKTAEQRVKSTATDSRGALEIPFWPIAGKNHGTIVSDPGATLVDLVVRALEVDSLEKYEGWCVYATTKTKGALDKVDQWQQFVVHATDERGDGISDYYVEFFTKTRGKPRTLEFDFDVHAYGADKSYRCFHVNLTELRTLYSQQQLDNLWLRIIASSGSQLVGYHGVGSEKYSPDLTEMNAQGLWDAQIQLPSVMGEDGIRFFYPFTTTFIEFCLNRDPLPFGQVENKVCGFLRD
jgi:hypothetical protein